METKNVFSELILGREKAPRQIKATLHPKMNILTIYFLTGVKDLVKNDLQYVLCLSCKAFFCVQNAWKQHTYMQNIYFHPSL